ncbi:MAG: RHS repeat protein [Lachnospiraceae bacterium]|nr:RHS repeat protein [Lachnospiraceae bacterium]
MLHINNRGAVVLSKKAWRILIGSIIGAALAAWIILMVSIFRKEKPVPAEDVNKQEEYVLPEIPEGYALVFRCTKRYDASTALVEQTSVSRYDSNGREIERITAAGLTDTYIYDERGNMLSHSRSTNGQVYFREDFSYDSENHLLVRTHDDETYEYVYNDRGLVAEVYYSSDKQKRVLNTGYEYDKQGYVSSEKSFDKNGEVISEYQYDYDSYGDIIRVGYGYVDVSLSYVSPESLETKYGDNWHEFRQQTYEYGSVGAGIRKVIKKTFKGSPEGEPNITLYTYDSCGRMTSREEYSSEDGGQPSIGEKYEYDDYGNIIVERREVYYSSNRGKTEKYEYEPFVIPIEMMTDEDKERIPNPGKP